MLRLSEILLQLLACALHTHLEGRHPGTGQLGDLLVLEIFYVLEEKRLAVVGGEARESPVDCVGPIQAVGPVGMRGPVQGLRVVRQRFTRIPYSQAPKRAGSSQRARER